MGKRALSESFLMRRAGAASTLATGAVVVSALGAMVGGLGLTRFGRGEDGADIVL